MTTTEAATPRSPEPPTPLAAPADAPVEPAPGARCFGDGDPLYEEYHDTEWGRPVHGEEALFERLALEAFQSGLAWITVLRKRPAFRAAFAGFDPEVVAQFSEADVERLLQDASIIRNRLKIEATVSNARALLALHEQGRTLDELVWSFAPGGSRAPDDGTPVDRPRPRTFADVAASTPESVALATALKKEGFRFIGPTTAYAAMQACGLVDDHLVTCPVVTGHVRAGASTAS